MKATHITFSIIGIALLGACVEELPPRTTSEFLEYPILLEAAMVRCAENRSRTKYEAECVNAREAVNRMAAVEEVARKSEFDRQSERKRQALRRTQQAAADARRRAAEMQRLREEAEYLGQFSAGPIEGNADTSVQYEMSGLGRQESPASDAVNALIGNEPGMVVAPVREETEDVATSSDLDAIRRELKRRQDESQ